METLNIALCITDLRLGGAERCLVELATRLDRRRFRPVVYCLGPRPKVEDASCAPMLEAAEIEVHCLGGRGNWEILRVLRRLKRLLDAQHPQLLQSFLFHANIVGRIAARRAGVKTVVSAVRVAEQRSRWHLWLDRLTDRLVDRYVCVSRSVARFSETQAGLPAAKLVVIPNGVDLERHPAKRPADLRAYGIAAGRRVVTYVGRLERQKGLPWLIDAARAWLGQLPDCDLLLVGEGPQRRRLQRMCRRRGLCERVHFAGWRADVPEILAASNLLVLPSAWEGMPNVVLEAMASRLPVVATDVEGVRELLGPAAEDQTVRFGDSQTFADKVVRFLQHGQAATEVCAANRRRAEENFSLTRMVTAYEQLWESLVAG